MIAAGLAAPGLARAQPVDLFFERAAMMAADSRCGLFAPAVSQALAAGAAQARGTALRAGVSPETLKTAERNARARAQRTACRSPELAASAERVRDAFDGYARLYRLTYPGDFASWRADRIAARKVRWRLVQEARFGRDRLSFGLAGAGETGHLMAVARFADGAEPYGARLVTRDIGRTTGPYLDRYYGGPTAALPLHRRVPPASAQRGYLAEARSPAGQDLLPDDARSGWAFRFPAQAVRQLAGLDPREAVVVEFLFADGVRRAYVEIGDFAAGRAFLQAPAVSGRTRPAQVAFRSLPTQAQ
ncbi:hypothetical protein [Phenylobacterium sp.]|uniref:hypothetical protein n=1 Tax=Phenylobacterium sp. TaxID=1871053 RepID=UPI0035AF4CB8